MAASIDREPTAPCLPRKRFYHHSRDEILEKKTSSAPRNTNLCLFGGMFWWHCICKFFDWETESERSARARRIWLGLLVLGARKQTTDGETPGSIPGGTGGKPEARPSPRLLIIKLRPWLNLENFRHSLNRYLKAPPHEKPFDIIKDKEFCASNKSIKAVACSVGLLSAYYKYNMEQNHFGGAICDNALGTREHKMVRIISVYVNYALHLKR